MENLTYYVQVPHKGGALIGYTDEQISREGFEEQLKKEGFSPATLEDLKERGIELTEVKSKDETKTESKTKSKASKKKDSRQDSATTDIEK